MKLIYIYIFFFFGHCWFGVFSRFDFSLLLLNEIRHQDANVPSYTRILSDLFTAKDSKFNSGRRLLQLHATSTASAFLVLPKPLSSGRHSSNKTTKRTCQFISSRLGQFRFWNHNSGVVNLWGANCSHNTVPFSFSTIFFFLYSTYFNLFAPAILAVWVTSYNDDHELHWTVSAVLLLNELYRTYFKNQYCVEYRWTILYKLF